MEDSSSLQKVSFLKEVAFNKVMSLESDHARSEEFRSSDLDKPYPQIKFGKTPDRPSLGQLDVVIIVSFSVNNSLVVAGMLVTQGSRSYEHIAGTSARYTA